MNFLSKDIERLYLQNNNPSLVRKSYSCGIFQDYGPGAPAGTPTITAQKPEGMDNGQ